MALAAIIVGANAQTCTVNNGSGSWTTRTCSEGGSLTSSFSGTVVIPSGAVVTSNSNNQILTNTGEVFVESGGELFIQHQNVVINGDLNINTGGTLRITPGKLQIGSAPGCGYVLRLDGTLILPDPPADGKIFICGTEVARSGSAGCTEPPTCAGPTGGTIAGPIGFDENGQNPAVLPVELLFFRANQTVSGVDLKWATATEKNFHYFSIQRSKDASAWEEVGQLAGSGNSKDRVDYAFVDSNPLPATSYYRLEAIDFDGSTEIFSTISVNMNNSGDFAINPSLVTTSKVFVVFDTEYEISPIVRIIDLSGKVQYLETVVDNEINLPNHLRKGVYVAEISIAGTTYHRSRIIIQR